MHHNPLPSHHSKLARRSFLTAAAASLTSAGCLWVGAAEPRLSLRPVERFQLIM